MQEGRGYYKGEGAASQSAGREAGREGGRGCALQRVSSSRSKMLARSLALLALCHAAWGPSVDGAPRTVTPSLAQKRTGSVANRGTVTPRPSATPLSTSRTKQVGEATGSRPTSPATFKTTPVPDGREDREEPLSTSETRRARLSTEKATEKPGTNAGTGAAPKAFACRGSEGSFFLLPGTERGVCPLSRGAPAERQACRQKGASPCLSDARQRLCNRIYAPQAWWVSSRGSFGARSRPSEG